MIAVRNIYYMLSYAYRGLTVSGIRDTDIEAFENAADLFAAILSKGVAAQVKRGLKREYIPVTEELSAPKGKIDLSASLRPLSTHSRKLVCVHDQFSENTYENRAVKAALLLLRGSDLVLPERKRQLKRALLFLANVDAIRPRDIDWPRIRLCRVSASYKALLNLCYIIVEGMLQTTEDGRYRLQQFVDDQRMSALYERFVLEFYRRHFPELHAAPSYVFWASDDGNTEFLPAMKTDITLSNREKVLIIDTKYYGRTMQTNSRFHSRSIHSGNLYQIYSYVKNKDRNHTGNVSGLLLYAKTDEPITPDNSYLIDGNRLSVKTLDLGAEFESIAAQLRAIAGLL